MNITTKFNFGDRVEFERKQETVGGSKLPTEIHVGIVEKILVTEKGISYLMKSSYQTWVDENDILGRLVMEE
jgi:hypothetical protein